MRPLVSWPGSPSDKEHHDAGELRAIVIAILFAAIALISFAVDQSLTLSNLPPAASTTSR